MTSDQKIEEIKELARQHQSCLDYQLSKLTSGREQNVQGEVAILGDIFFDQIKAIIFDEAWNSFDPAI